ncbi:GNAT family N-acetyltransferase [Shimazuella sp. AN120528]|uniref:GNAT family N-acetyltransferase n=1 Tax=Shimazuella soli TaxID=1892854 RepID=UPI001F102F4C|nr:GNAT family N-acetyltransferase [Shimazuella soli]MCH5585567.1 GNAT family N-acetyltransferase [Shimazuella soli]
MQKVEIRRPNLNDVKELHSFFDEVIHDTFAKEGLSDWNEDITTEVQSKQHHLQLDLSSNGEIRYFLIAIDPPSNSIVGTIECGSPNNIITSNTNKSWKKLIEIATVFVHPNYQRKGIGNTLLHSMLITLLSRGIQEFCLDSGYSRAQNIWENKFGAPNILLKDFWGPGMDHLIWRRSIKETPILFSTNK